MKSERSFLKTRNKNSTFYIDVSGVWSIASAGEKERALKTLNLPSSLPQSVILDFSKLESVDTAGAWLLNRYYQNLKQKGIPVALDNLKEEHFKLLQTIMDMPEERCPPLKIKRGFFPVMETLGEATIGGLINIGDILAFIGRLFVTFARNFKNPSHFRLSSIVRHIDEAGIRAVPIVSLLAFLISIVVAYQGASQLKNFGAEMFTIDLTAISILREMGVLMTAILVAGRSGSAFTAEIGVMKIREEVDALNAMGIDPYEVMILPRVLAMIIVLPILTLIANVSGLAGGALMSMAILDIPLNQYIDRVLDATQLSTFMVGMVKAPVFAFIIATVATFRGMQVRGSSESVGKMTTVSVVQSIFIVILADAVFSIIFSELGI